MSRNDIVKVDGSIDYDYLGDSIDGLSSQMADIAINVKTFGAKGDGVTDDTISIMACIAYAQSLISSKGDKDGSRAYILFPQGYYIVSETLIVNPRFVSLGSFGGATIEFISGTYTNNICINATSSNSNGWITATGSEFVRNLTLVDLSKTLTGIKAESNVISSSSLLACYNLKFWGFNIQWENGDNAWGWSFFHCGFEGFKTGFKINNATNTYERFDFHGCIFQNGQIPVSINNPNGKCYFYGCSFDYFSKSVELNQGNMALIGCHIEGKNWTEPLFKLMTANSTLQINNCMLASTGQDSLINAFGIINSVANDYNVSIENLTVQTSSQFFGKLYLIDTNNKIKLNGVSVNGDVATLELFKCNATLVSSHLAEANIGDVDLTATGRTSPSTTSGGGIIDLSSSDFVSGTKSIRMNKGSVSTGGDFAALFYIPIRNAKYVKWGLKLKSSATFNASVSATVMDVAPPNIANPTSKYVTLKSQNLNNGTTLTMDGTWKSYLTPFVSVANCEYLRVEVNLFFCPANTDVFLDDLNIYVIE